MLSRCSHLLGVVVYRRLAVRRDDGSSNAATLLSHSDLTATFPRRRSVHPSRSLPEGRSWCLAAEAEEDLVSAARVFTASGSAYPVLAGIPGRA